MWPLSLPMPEGLRFYQRATIQQGTMNAIDPWRVPGGLSSINASQWTSYVGVAQSGQQLWSEGGRWRRAFKPGTTFVDLLVGPEGKAFEVRQRRRESERWVEGAVYREREHSPLGYTRPEKQCSECHSQAGVNGLRGDDQTFSFPVTPK